MNNAAELRLKFLRNVAKTGGRPAFARIGDEHPYRPGDRLVQVCVGDVVVAGEVALVCCSGGFERIDSVPPYEDGLSEADLLIALRAAASGAEASLDPAGGGVHLEEG